MLFLFRLFSISQLRGPTRKITKIKLSAIKGLVNVTHRKEETDQNTTALHSVRIHSKRMAKYLLLVFITLYGTCDFVKAKCDIGGN